MQKTPHPIRVSITKEYRSIIPMELNFPRFVVISGLNGSGKSHLLEALSNKEIVEVSEGDESLDKRKLVPSKGLEPRLEGIGEFSSPNALFQRYENVRRLRSKPNQISKDWRTLLGRSLYRRVCHIVEFSNKEMESLKLTDFEKYLPIDDAGTEEDPFSQNFEILLRRRHERYLENRQNRWRNEDLKEDIDYLSDEEFTKRYGSDPGVEINSILEAADLPYELNSPRSFSDKDLFRLKLVNKVTKKEITLEDLSSGEKVIMSLAFSMYNSRKDYDLPQVLLLDEPDASLHPSTIKQFLDVIEGVFVEERGVFVIVSTHSPSTVALAPEEALFAMNKTDRRPYKVTKDKLLKELLDGVVSLSINYENRRQVFVESDFDVRFYDRMYQLLKPFLADEITLSFISSGTRRENSGDCGQVKRNVNEMRRLGNKQIFGIVDWDFVNSGNEHIKVLGKDKRYSLENYLLDPFVLCIYLLVSNQISFADVGLLERNSKNFSSLTLADEERMVGYIVNRIRPRINPSDEESVEVDYVEGKKMRIPSWFLLCKGHDLEEHIEEEFSLANDENGKKWQIEILEKFDSPNLISIDILRLFQQIETA